MAFSEDDVFLVSLKSVAFIGIIIIFDHMLVVFQQAFKADRITKSRLGTALYSQFNMETIKYDVLGGAIIIFLAMLCCFVTKFDHTLTLILASRFLWLFRKKNSEPAIGLAWTYYFGYLRIILPKYAENCRKSKNKDYLIPKLFILIPSDSRVYDRLDNADNRIEFAENLSAVIEDVAGVRVRKYVNTLYRVQINSEDFYAAIEYATPLKTLRAMSDHKDAGFSKQDRYHQTVVFYETIKGIINNHADPPEIKDRVEFIYLEDRMSIADEIYKTILASVK